MKQWSHATLSLIDLALAEDIGAADITTQALIPASQKAAARVLAKERLLVCGQEIAELVFSRVDVGLQYRTLHADGTWVEAGTFVAEVSGRFASILTGERTALNFLQRLSGIAGNAYSVTSAIADTKTRVLDTRKTTPGWREIEKYAVKIGGGVNHRIGLFDQILIKNNHVDAFGGDLQKAVEQARKLYPPPVRVEVEVRDEKELEQALRGRPDIILFDNFTPERLSLALKSLESGDPERRVVSEASGGITAESIRAYAETGVNFVSLGALTHSARAVDLALRFVDEHPTN